MKNATQLDRFRRSFLLSAVGYGASITSIAGALSACAKETNMNRQLLFASLDDAVRELDRLEKAPALESSAVWTWPQTMIHCAQSLMYSLTGFPEPKSALFQRTLGAAAFTVFSWRGRMSHDLGEPIPGAPTLDRGADAASAARQLRRSIHDFRNSKQPLRPHFAYGALTKAEYEHAHAMHLANHFSAFNIKT